MLKVAAPLLLLLVLVSDSLAEEEGAVRLDQSLRDLASDFRVVSLAARPGDEDLEVLAILRRRYGVATHVILATAGEGVGSVPPWGLAAHNRQVRIREARRAAHAVGARLTWLGLPDFGIARAGEEALERWDREDAVVRLVSAIRSIRPHLVFTDYRDAGRRGAAEAAETLVMEAFAAASDPLQYPEAGPVWTVVRVFTACAEDEAVTSVDTGVVDLQRGISYATMAGRARRAYSSVELRPEAAIAPGPRPRFFRLAASSVEGAPEKMSKWLPVPRPEWLEEGRLSGTREEILASLLALRAASEDTRPPAEKLDAAMLAALNVTLEVSAHDRILVEEQAEAVRFSLVNGGTRSVTVTGITVDPLEGLGIENPEVGPTELAPGGAISGKLWVVPTAESIGDRMITIRAVLALSDTEPLTLKTRALLEVRPTVGIQVRPWTRMIRPVDQFGFLYVVLTNYSREALEGPLEVAVRGTDRVRLTPPKSVRVEPGASALIPVRIQLKDDARVGLFSLHLEFADHYHQDIFRVADVNVPLESRVGCVATESDAAFRALRALRILPLKLSDVDLETADLTVLDTIVIGARPFVNRPALRRVLPRLVEFVKGGGNIFLSYSRPGDWVASELLSEFTYGTERVTREDAELIVAYSDHRLFNVPNEIESEDLSGWVLERGRYFPATFNENRYEVLLKCADPGYPLQAALLVVKLGEGHVIQSSLTWRPQLEMLNPGALKFLANVVSLPWNR
jgi:LmbE family N-acetylglucosaminyl deacetylase